MKRVLIVDDESWVIESLRGGIDWGKHGFVVCGQALNGMEALTFIQEHWPDVVFTDVRMPGMNGLELIRQAQKIGSQAAFVVVSGYAEFSYVQKAMHSGALGYCLKPYDEDEVDRLLERLSQHLLKAQRMVDDPLLSWLEEDGETAQRELANGLRQHGLNPSASLLVAVVISREELLWRGDLQIYRAKLGSGKQVIIMETQTLISEKCTERAQTKADRLTVEDIVALIQTERKVAECSKSTDWPTAIMGIGCATALGGTEGLHEAIGKASIMARQYFILNRQGVFFEREQSLTDFNLRLNELKDAVRGKDVSECHRLFSVIEQLFTEGDLTVKHAVYVYNMLIVIKDHQQNGWPDRMLHSYEQLFDMFGDVEEMLIHLRNELIEGMLRQTESSSKPRHESLKQLLSYVNEHFMEELSIPKLAQQFFIHPNYLSQLFRREVGETFTTYLARLRIAHACRLLQETNILINEIAEKCGYDDYFYFTRMFKKMTGRTPTQHRLIDKS